MSNIILTTDCQRKCSYCFAKDNHESHIQFNMENFVTAIDWIQKENPYLERIGLLGGEPTSHPDFIKFVDYLLSKRLSTIVFTNGMIEDSSFYESIIQTARKNEVRNITDFSFCLNLNEPKYRSKNEERLQDLFLKNLGRVTTMSFNVFEKNFNPNFLFDVIKNYNTAPMIRFGLASPLGNDNNFLDPENFIEVGKKLIDFCGIATDKGLRVSFDCGFTACMFLENSSLDKLKQLNVDLWLHNCGPTIDIYPNLEVASCFPTSRQLREKMENWINSVSLYDYWDKKLKEVPPIYEKCNSCEYYTSNKCFGGCKAHNING